jgi:hypothetical protein
VLSDDGELLNGITLDVDQESGVPYWAERKGTRIVPVDLALRSRFARRSRLRVLGGSAT